MAYVIKCITYACYKSRHGYDTSLMAAIRYPSYLEAAKALVALDPPASDGKFRIVRLKPKPAKGETYEAIGFMKDRCAIRFKTEEDAREHGCEYWAEPFPVYRKVTP